MDEPQWAQDIKPGAEPDWAKDLGPRAPTDQGFAFLARNVNENTGDRELQQAASAAAEAQDPEVREQYRRDLLERGKAHVLGLRVQNATNYMNSGYFGVRRTGGGANGVLSDIAERMPHLKDAEAARRAWLLNQSSARFENHEATPDDYEMLAQRIARERYDAQNDGGERLYNMTMGAPAFLTEWSGLTKLASKFGLKAAERGIAEAFPRFMARYGGKAAALGAVQAAPLIPGAAIQRTGDRIDLDENGRPVMTPGEPALKAVAKSGLENWLTMTAFEGLGALNFKTQPGFLNWLKSTVAGTGKAAVAQEGAKEASHYVGGTSPGYVTQLVNAKTPEERNRILKEAGVEVGFFGGMEALMHGVNGAKASIDRSNVKQKLIASGATPEQAEAAVNAMIESSLDRVQYENQNAMTPQELAARINAGKNPANVEDILKKAEQPKQTEGASAPTQPGEQPGTVVPASEDPYVQTSAGWTTRSDAKAKGLQELFAKPEGEANVQPPAELPSEPAQSQPATPALADWLSEALDMHYKNAQALGVVDLIEQRAADRDSGTKIAADLRQKMSDAGLDPGDAKAMVNAVRSRLNIPSMDEPTAFEKWRQDYRNRQPALEAAAPPAEEPAKPAPKPLKIHDQLERHLKASSNAEEAGTAEDVRMRINKDLRKKGLKGLTMEENQAHLDDMATLGRIDKITQPGEEPIYVPHEDLPETEEALNQRIAQADKEKDNALNTILASSKRSGRSEASVRSQLGKLDQEINAAVEAEHQGQGAAPEGQGGIGNQGAASRAPSPGNKLTLDKIKADLAAQEAAKKADKDYKRDIEAAKKWIVQQDAEAIKGHNDLVDRAKKLGEQYGWPKKLTGEQFPDSSSMKGLDKVVQSLEAEGYLQPTTDPSGQTEAAGQENIEKVYDALMTGRRRGIRSDTALNQAKEIVDEHRRSLKADQQDVQDAKAELNRAGFSTKDLPGDIAEAEREAQSEVLRETFGSEEGAPPTGAEGEPRTAAERAGIPADANDYLFSGVPVPRELWDAVAGRVRDFGNSLRVMFSPASVSEAAKATAGNIRERLTKLVRRDDIAQQAHYAAKAYLDRAVASEADPAAFRRKFLDFTTPYETGGPSNMPAQYQEFGKVIKRLKDEVTQQLVSRGLLQSWIDNHLGHAWKDPRNPQATPEEIAAKIIGGKKPLAGGEGFRKQRTLPTWEDGFNAGFEPAVRNPIEAELASLHSMYKSIFGHDIFGEEKEAGRAKFVKLGKSAPSGWVQIPDKFANQFARSYEENLPMLVGKWYMPEESARLIDRYLQPGMRGNGVFDAAIGLTNEINKLNLGLSAFHALGTTFNAQMNALELGIRQALVGSRGESIPNIVKGIIPLTAVVSDFIAGTKASKEWYNPGSQGAEMGTILESLEQAGARAHMGGEYQYNAIENFRTAWRQNKDAYTILGTGLRALNEVVSYPIMGLLVPRVKLGAMVNRARFILEQLGPNSTPDQQREALYREWQSIENRMGQVTYDNLFWNRTMRDALHIGIRSVGWNAGDIGEAGGAVADLPASIASLKAGKPISPRIAYMFALPVVAAINGSILHYAMTGQAPQSALDMFYPKTGGTRDDGSDDRLAIPTYMKDFYALGQRAERGPFQWAENTYHAAAGKKSPLISVMGEMLSNKDFFDKPIRNPNDPVTKQAQDEVTHLLKAMEPFSIRQGGISATGLSPAPAYIVRGKEGEVVDDFYDALKRSQEAHTKFTRDAQKGLDVTGYRQEDLNRYHVLRRTEAQMTKLNAALRQAKSPEDKKYIKSLQAQVAQQALGQR